MKKILALALLLSNSLFAEDYSWVQYVDNNRVVAKFVTENAQCPKIKIDDKLIEMNFRTSYQDAKLKTKITVCEADVTNASKASLNGVELKLPAKKVNRFVVIGDTGCENSFFDSKARKQKCDKQHWPFEQIANKVAGLKADFIIHTGDYLYQDHYKKPTDALRNKEMQWYFFKEDFFKPARNMLMSAPMIFVRGNHESCKYGGIGWFAFFESKASNECKQYTDSYNIRINDLNFIVFDSSGSNNGPKFPQDQLDKYSQDFLKIYNNSFTNHWLLIHQPVIILEKLSEDESFPEKMHAKVIEQAFKSEYSKKIPVAISGHYHAMALIERELTKFSQIIVGNSGTYLNESLNDNYTIRTAKDDLGIIKVRHGYTIFDRVKEDLWKMSSYDLNENLLLTTNFSSK